MKAKSDIGADEVNRLATSANKKSTVNDEVNAEQVCKTNTKITILTDGTVIAENNDIDEMFDDLVKKGIF
ncbi:MAG: hypothetical protein RSB59_04695 [Clostridia bacterium]